MSCDLALKLEKFTREVVAPQAQAHFHQGVAEIIHFGAYSCRGRPGGEWSEHAKGDAIDIAGFKLADGTVISVKQDWNPPGPKRDFLRAVARGACGLFSMVLTPKTNSEHANHFHLDIGAYHGMRRLDGFRNGFRDGFQVGDVLVEERNPGLGRDEEPAARSRRNRAAPRRRLRAARAARGRRGGAASRRARASEGRRPAPDDGA